MRAALLALVVALPRVASASDPHELFANGKFDAAAAEYEREWQQSAKSTDGINAVVAWRAAGHYAHARVMLAAVKKRSPPNGKQASFVAMLDERLEAVTGVLAIEKAPSDLVVKLDGVPAELLDGEIVVDVGRRDLTIERHGCEPFHDTLLVRPTERVVVEPKLECKQLPGNLHVVMHGAGSALVITDGVEHDLAGFDFDIPLEPGRHHVIVQRRGTIVSDDEVDITAGQTTRRSVDVPWRARNFGFLVEVAQHAFASPYGVSQVTTGGVGFFGIFGGNRMAADGKPNGFDHHAGFRPMGGLAIDFGAGTSTLEGVSGSVTFWIAMHMGVKHMFGPLWTARHGSTTYTLDFDPLWGTFGGTGKGNALEGTRSAAFMVQGLPVTLTAETSIAHFELTAWPAGIAILGGETPGMGNNSWDFARDKSYSASLTLSAGWSVDVGM